MTLVEELTAAAPRLGKRVMDEMYRDPFWHARYAERGRKNSDQDNDFHIQYLCEALAAGTADVFERYARWLRGLLVAHGICSQHLAENFARLAAAIGDEPWPERERAIAVLHAGEHALSYTDGEAGELDAARAHIEEAAPGTATYRSYLADALALGGPDRLVAYAVLRAKLDGIEDATARLNALAAALPPMPAARAILALALAALPGGVS
ncbi:MAG TPA: hypothetical protein VGM88_02345 [Kofleriaceae bacterium]|jgi:hypothetical protein